MRADNKGEGGMLTLLALVQGALGRRSVLLSAGRDLRRGAVLRRQHDHARDLRAVGGRRPQAREPGDHALRPTDLALGILIGLFAVQKRGTGNVAAWFGPITAVWFLVMAALGVAHIADDLEILAAFDPRHGLWFLFSHGLVGFVVLGAVFLAVTGAEALYADMGHFGRDPIRFAGSASSCPP